MTDRLGGVRQIPLATEGAGVDLGEGVKEKKQRETSARRSEEPFSAAAKKHVHFRRHGLN